MHRFPLLRRGDVGLALPRLEERVAALHHAGELLQAALGIGQRGIGGVLHEAGERVLPAHQVDGPEARFVAGALLEENLLRVCELLAHRRQRRPTHLALQQRLHPVDALPLPVDRPQPLVDARRVRVQLGVGVRLRGRGAERGGLRLARREHGRRKNRRRGRLVRLGNRRRARPAPAGDPVQRQRQRERHHERPDDQERDQVAEEVRYAGLAERRAHRTAERRRAHQPEPAPLSQPEPGERHRAHRDDHRPAHDPRHRVVIHLREPRDHHEREYAEVDARDPRQHYLCVVGGVRRAGLLILVCRHSADGERMVMRTPFSARAA
jgi:hypothetical protein